MAHAGPEYETDMRSLSGTTCLSAPYAARRAFDVRACAIRAEWRVFISRGRRPRDLGTLVSPVNAVGTINVPACPRPDGGLIRVAWLQLLGTYRATGVSLRQVDQTMSELARGRSIFPVGRDVERLYHRARRQRAVLFVKSAARNPRLRAARTPNPFHPAGSDAHRPGAVCTSGKSTRVPSGRTAGGTRSPAGPMYTIRFLSGDQAAGRAPRHKTHGWTAIW
jgi:hypothetical protein